MNQVQTNTFCEEHSNARENEKFLCARVCVRERKANIRGDKSVKSIESIYGHNNIDLQIVIMPVRVRNVCDYPVWVCVRACCEIG